ncbi:hypothetical protein [Halorhodospira halophila]|uniref:hypothetical protein n=1 Tax=Halorhodospira halophila TaxID=1053 RepID=UPI0011981D5D|nr:hypothetical protein [Halorhodospira halophila]
MAQTLRERHWKFKKEPVRGAPIKEISEERARLLNRHAQRIANQNFHPLYIKEAIKKICLDEALEKKDSCTIVDEGFFYWFMHDLYGAIQENRTWVHKLLQRRAIIELIVPPEKTAERALFRSRRGGKVARCHAEKSYHEIVKMSEERIIATNAFTKAVEQLGVPVARIDWDEKTLAFHRETIQKTICS